MLISFKWTSIRTQGWASWSGTESWLCIFRLACTRSPARWHVISHSVPWGWRGSHVMSVSHCSLVNLVLTVYMLNLHMASLCKLSLWISCIMCFRGEHIRISPHQHKSTANQGCSNERGQWIGLAIPNWEKNWVGKAWKRNKHSAQECTPGNRTRSDELAASCTELCQQVVRSYTLYLIKRGLPLAALETAGLNMQGHSCWGQFSVVAVGYMAGFHVLRNKGSLAVCQESQLAAFSLPSSTAYYC